jgi:hypothetical protein
MTTCLVVTGSQHLSESIAAVMGTQDVKAVPTTFQQMLGSLSRQRRDNLPARFLSPEEADQILVVFPADELASRWLVDGVDGPRWNIVSSPTTAGAGPPSASLVQSLEETVARRGAVVLRAGVLESGMGDGPVSRIVRSMAQWRMAILFGRRATPVDFVHLHDISVLAARLSRAPAASGIYPLSGGDPVPVLEFATMVAQLLGIRVLHVKLPRWMERTAVASLDWLGPAGGAWLQLCRRPASDDGYARSRLGWDPRPLPHRLEEVCAARFGWTRGRARP